MGIFRWLERKLFLGEILHDYGVIEETHAGVARLRISLLLCRKRGEIVLVIKESGVAPIGFSVRYTSFRRESLVPLRQALDDALTRAT